MSRVCERSWLASLVAALGLVGPGCLTNEGVDPPKGALAFPSALRLVDARADAVSAPTHLLVANTNFDLAYNAASLQSFDLDALDAALDANCVQAGVLGSECAVVPVESGRTSESLGNFRIHAVQGVLASEALIGSYAEGIAVAPDGLTVYIPNRSDEDLTRVTLGESGVLSCGATDARNTCDDTFRESDTALAQTRGLELPNEPLDVHVGPMTDFGSSLPGHYLVVAHRYGGASLFHATDGATAPQLLDVLSLGAATVPTLTFDPFNRRFLAPSGNGSILLRFAATFSSFTSSPTDAHLERTVSLSLVGFDTGTQAPSLRQVLVDPSGSGRLFITALRPTALIVARPTVGSNQLTVEAVLPLGGQPARSAFATIGGRPLLFVSCYTSRELYVFDTDALRLVSVVRGFNGPFETEVDVARGRLYVTDFRVSVVRVLDTQPLEDCLALGMAPGMEPSCAPVAMGMLGVPSTVEELR